MFVIFINIFLDHFWLAFFAEFGTRIVHPSVQLPCEVIIGFSPLYSWKAVEGRGGDGAAAGVSATAARGTDPPFPAVVPKIAADQLSPPLVRTAERPPHTHTRWPPGGRDQAGSDSPAATPAPGVPTQRSSTALGRAFRENSRRTSSCKSFLSYIRRRCRLARRWFKRRPGLSILLLWRSRQVRCGGLRGVRPGGQQHAGGALDADSAERGAERAGAAHAHGDHGGGDGGPGQGVGPPKVPRGQGRLPQAARLCQKRRRDIWFVQDFVIIFLFMLYIMFIFIWPVKSMNFSLSWCLCRCRTSYIKHLLLFYRCWRKLTVFIVWDYE